MNVLIIGSGGREHAFAWKINQSPLCKALYVAPGNAGTSGIAENVELNASDFNAIKEFVLSKKIDLLVVGPEAPLVAGITDYFREEAELQDILVIGPAKEAANLEGSKDFAKQFMLRHGIPTGKAMAFTKENLEDGKSYLETMEPPYVLKADGLAAGKGVLIIDNLSEAKSALERMLVQLEFGAASETVLVEEHLSGIELSVFVLTDGQDYVILPEAKDYKRIGENDTGLNTGGMGAVSPVPFADQEFMQKVEEQIVKPTIEGIKKDQLDYIGFIFIGLMNVKGNPKVIEYNVRMGDPETQVVLPRIQNDFMELLVAAAQKNLKDSAIISSSDTACTVIMASGGYPGSYEKGKKITGLDSEESTVFHAGTTRTSEGVVTSSGRVLAITGMGNSIKEALAQAYRQVGKITWEGCYFRKDIGQDLL